MHVCCSCSLKYQYVAEPACLLHFKQGGGNWRNKLAQKEVLGFETWNTLLATRANEVTHTELKLPAHIAGHPSLPTPPPNTLIHTNTPTHTHTNTHKKCTHTHTHKHTLTHTHKHTHTHAHKHTHTHTLWKPNLSRRSSDTGLYCTNCRSSSATGHFRMGILDCVLMAAPTFNPWPTLVPNFGPGFLNSLGGSVVRSRERMPLGMMDGWS